MIFINTKEYMKAIKYFFFVFFLFYNFLFPGCGNYNSVTRSYELRIMNASGTEITDINLLFLKKTIQNLNPEEEYVMQVIRRIKGPKGNGSPDNYLTPDEDSIPVYFDECKDYEHLNIYNGPNHLEYSINGNQYTGSSEQGDFAGKDIKLTGPILLITIYADHYSMEIQDYEEENSDSEVNGE